ncbi:MAG: hypothetical protein IIT58_07545 [Treponema sp.]|nr:hypothetical protein [Treponema sp.]
MNLFVSCRASNKIKSISETQLFTLNYGNFEEQLNLFNINNPGSIRTYMAMRDGFFYVVNGESNKVVSFNSYGDLLSLYYNEDAYSTVNAGLAEKSSNGIWKPVSYPFTFNGKIAIDSRKYMYVVGTVPKERNEQDENQKLLYSQVVLRVTSDGSSIDYIGQEGPGGTPFPFIKEIYTTENDELVVVCTTNDGLTAYWFGTNGFLRYKIPVNVKDAPQVTSEALSSYSAGDLFVTVENIIPDCYSLRLYVKIDYYLSHIDEESKVQSGIDYVESYIFPLNIDTGMYGEPLNLPPFEESVTSDFSKLTYKLPYDFLGVTKHGWLFFLITTPTGFNVEMIQPGTQLVQKRHLDVNHSETLYYSLNLSHEGIISALLAEKDGARMVWWRTDTLVDSVLH